MLVASFMLAVPVIYEKYDKLATLARAMKVPRVSFILTGAETSLSLLIACVSNQNSVIYSIDPGLDLLLPSQRGPKPGAKMLTMTLTLTREMTSRMASRVGVVPRRPVPSSCGLPLVRVLSL